MTWEDEAIAEWERLNDNPLADALKNAAKGLAIVGMNLDVCVKCLIEAANAVDGSPANDRLMSLANDLEDIKISLRELGGKFERGSCG